MAHEFSDVVSEQAPDDSVEVPSPETTAAEAVAVEEVLADEEFTAEVTEPDGSIAEIVYEADPVLLAAVEQARAALAEITPASTIGEFIGHEVEGEHVLSLFFASQLPGYPDWHWTATLARVGDTDEPSVLEVELLPGEGSVLSPVWVPWADRLTADAIVDDSESEFDDDDDEGGYGDDSDDGDSDGDADDDDESDDDDGSDEEDDSEESDEEEVASLALRRDRDGIDIDTIADESFEVQHPELTLPEADADADAAIDTDGDAPAEAPTAIDADAGAAFDATDDFTNAGDIEDLEGLDPEADGR